MTMLEICCYNTHDAVLAEEAGADRIELCSGRMEGGLTPSYGELVQAKEKISIPVHPIVRPRGGDFYYTDDEINTMQNDIVLIRELGFVGVVFGLLKVDAHVDVAGMKQLMALTGGMDVTFHRAFDMCYSPRLALTQLADMGIKRILTSGQQKTAEMGLPLIIDLINQSTGPIILAGGGLRAGNIDQFIAAGVQEYHSSANRSVASPMRYRQAGISMSTGADQQEFDRFTVDAGMISAMKNSLMS